MDRSSSSSSVPVENVDWISTLPDDLLLMIVSRLSTEEAVRTSVVSKRWEHVWKHMSRLVLDMRKKCTDSNITLDVSNRVATLMTKIINNHRGHLESCVIEYDYTNGMLNTWFQSLTGVRQTKHLTLRHYFGLEKWPICPNFPQDSFSFSSLTSLSLSSYIFRTSHSFNNCQNLMTLKLSCTYAPDVGLFNRILASCPSLEVLVLGIGCTKKGGPLKIDNKRLKFLKVSSHCIGIDGMKVSSPSLHILVIVDSLSCGRYNSDLTSPLLQFNRNLARLSLPHVSYNISQEENCKGHEEYVVNSCGAFLRGWLALMSVSVDLMNPREVARLRQVLLVCPVPMIELELIFKNNNAPREEVGKDKLWSENIKEPFPNAKFRVDSLWMYNFSGSEEEFALVSCLIRQRTVKKNVMIKTTSFPDRKKLEIETAVAKLQALKAKDQWALSIKCF
ncbi:PREDICTED: F-box protein At1g80960-like [Camelina sativa]|uniref:F-box protein At1g80960-like n=1 Tax=Camelina sativa TaxID=90675 RepID=A0ABM1QU38_CAMSA|nr:PREDICTED: F-box protein At1g80960-like [Camelina sativa]XP_019090276.1 PREDICTED: F-box protein At1g80960-like [Camelina sativa]